MKELRKLIRQVIKEARTKQPGDLPQAELLSLANHILSGGDLFDFSEKFAGSHVEIMCDVEERVFLYKSKAGRSAGANWFDPRGKAKKITDQMSSLEIPEASRKFAFEFIDSAQRPDYINYLIGDTPAAIEYTGELSGKETQKLNNAQSFVKFVSLDDISHDSFDLTPQNIKEIQGIKDSLESGNLKRAELKLLGKKLSSIVASSVPGSMLGGPIEGLVVRSGEQLLKMPNPDYSHVQRLQSPLYAMFSGRGGVSKKDIKSRLESADSSDRLVQDMKKYLDSIEELPSGFRTFFSQEESADLLSLISLAETGDSAAGLQLYSKFNKRINDQEKWVNT